MRRSILPLLVVNALLLLLVVPIALMGWRWGPRPAWVAVVVALVLVGARSSSASWEPGLLDYLTIATAFGTVAMLAGALHRSGQPLDATSRDAAFEELLTRRELEVLASMAGGETNAEIADHLVIAESTVKSHVKSILRKLSVANRTEAVGLYFGAGDPDRYMNARR
jgi:DNA-binding CsgD family transcriptional regulator